MISEYSYYSKMSEARIFNLQLGVMKRLALIDVLTTGSSELALQLSVQQSVYFCGF